jgi:hypothetical protein
MNPGPPRQEPKLHPLIWWVIWAALLTGFLQVCYFLGGAPGAAPAASIELVAVLVGAGLLFLSAAIRRLLLPRIGRARVAFICFIVGQAFAEGCGYVGLFVGGAHRDPLVAGGVLGLLQFMPIFARRYDGGPAAATAFRGPGGPS